MEIFLGFLMIAGFIVIIVGAILFFIDYAKKNSKKISLIVLSSGLVLTLVGGIGAVSMEAHTEKIAAQKQAEKKEITKEKDLRFQKLTTAYMSALNDTWSDTVKLNNRTDKAWSDAIDSGSESFDVDKTIEKIETDNASLITEILSNQNDLDSDIKKMRTNNTGKYDFKKYETMNEKIKSYTNFVTNPSGSYSSYGDKTTGLNDAVTTAYDAINE